MHTHTSSAQTKSRRRAARTYTHTHIHRHAQHGLTHRAAHAHGHIGAYTHTYTHTHKFLTLLLACVVNWLYFFNVVSFYFRSFIRSLVRPFSVRALISTFALMRHSHVRLYARSFGCVCLCVLNMYKNGLPTQNNPLAAGLVSGSKSKRQPLSCILSHFIYMYMHRYICVCVTVSVCFNESIFYYLGYELEATSLPSALLFLFFLFCFTHVFDYNIYLYAYKHMYVCMYIFLYTSICFMYLQNLLIACVEY